MAQGNYLIMQYQEQAINTMSKGELLVRLYDELIKNLRFAVTLFQQNNPEAAKKCTEKCKNILNYLIVILDDRYEVSANLKGIYSFMIGQIIQANVHCSPDYLQKIQPEVQELRDAWAQAEKMTHMNK